MFDTYETIFAQRAENYHRAMRAYPQARAAEFEAMVAYLPSLAGGIIFDMPAGGGYLRSYLPPRLHYVAVEPTEAFYASCPVDARARRLHAGIECVPCRDGSADAVVSLAGLHHAPDLDAVFREMRRLVAPRGLVVIADVAEGSAAAQFLNGYVDRHCSTGHDGRFLDAHTVPMLEKAGLDVIEDAVIPVPWGFATPVQAGAFCRDLFGIEGQTAGDVERALDSIVGIRADERGFSLQWTLRRIVCRAR